MLLVLANNLEILVAEMQWWSQGTHKAKAKAKDLTCHAALKPQTLYTVQC